MKTPDIRTPAHIHELEDLLPFYATGKLGAADAARLEAALKDNAELARRLTLVQEERAEAIALNEALRASSPRALDALMARIEAEPRSATHVAASVRKGLIDRFGAMLAALSPRTLAYASAAAVAIIAIQGAVMTQVVGDRPGSASYQTASANDTGSFALIAFAAEAQAAQITGVLKAAGGTIVEGPRASGLYRVRLSTKALPPQEMAQRLAILRNAKGVISSADAEQ
jgi:hypothetical protein